jgi:hypothetical protein
MKTPFRHFFLGSRCGDLAQGTQKLFRFKLHLVLHLLHESKEGNALGGKLASYAAMIRNSFPSSCFLPISANPNGLPDFS